MSPVNQETVKKTLSLIGKNSANFGYFFSKLESPDWLAPLDEAHLFDKPYEPDRNENGVRFPFWPPSKYLIRIAGQKPREVMKIILKADETQNIRVHEDFVEAATLMPANISKKMVSQVTSWLSSDYKLLLPEKVAKLAIHLAVGGEQSAAFELVRVLLQLKPQLQVNGEETGEDSAYRPPQEPVGIMGEYDYESILDELTPPLLKVDAWKTLALYCELLSQALLMSVSKQEAEEKEDYSYIWRKAVEEDEDNFSNRFANLLITKIRLIVEFIGINSPVELPKLAEMLFGKEWPIFWRIGLHLLRKFPEHLSEFISRNLTSREFFENPTVRYEYYKLSEDQFNNLSATDKSVIIGWISEGPNTSFYKKNVLNFSGKEPTESEVNRYIMLWQRDRLAPLVEGLPDDWRDRWEVLLKELGTPDNPEFISGGSFSWIGPTSPKSSKELLAMPVDKLIDFLHKWVPGEGIHESTPEGLGRILADAVKEKPATYAEAAKLFTGLDPTYVRYFLFGLREAIRSGQQFPWAPVLELISTVLRYPREVSVRKSLVGETDPDWGWARRESAHLLGEGLSQSKDWIPFDLRKNIWSILEVLASDPDPTIEHEQKFGGDNMDPTTLSINTVRGEAMHATIQYALWCKKHLTKSNENSTGSISLGEMIEVREILEVHLDTREEPSLAIRSVYGQWFPQLVYLDEAWASKNASNIFPLKEGLELFLLSSWNAYLQYSRPYDKVLEILHPQYRWALAKLIYARASKESGRRDDLRSKLAEHLMIYYWRGRLGLEDELLTEFWNKVPIAISTYAVEFIGRNLKQSKEIILPEVKHRLQSLIEFRLGGIPPNKTDERNKELQGFGWWFASNAFEIGWSLSSLKEVLSRTGGKIKADHEVVKKLAEISPTHTTEAIDCLRQMVEAHRESWGMSLWIESIRFILRVGLKSPDHGVTSSAIDLIHYLGGKGYLELRDLLKE